MSISTELQRQHDQMRAEYMDHQITHQGFYLWLAKSIGLVERNLPVSVERVRASTDEHLNDIPLHMWDSQHLVVRGKAYAAGMRSWSLSDTVCTLKALARDLARVVQPRDPRTEFNNKADEIHLTERDSDA